MRPGCFSADTPQVAFIRRVIRVIALLGVLVLAVLIVPVVLVRRGQARLRLVRGAFRLVPRAAGIRLEIHGTDRFGDSATRVR